MEKVIVVVGPTGVGKTKIGVELALYFNGEIISVDSMQIYKGMDIGTAKVTNTEAKGIKHHLIDIKEIHETYSVYEAQKDIRALIKDIISRNKTPIIVGGTGLFIRASLYDYIFLPKEEMNNLDYGEFGNEELHELLKKKDLETARTLHPNNRRRIIRALKMSTQEKKSDLLKKQSKQLLYDAKIIGITLPRNILYERINLRVDEMIKEGLLHEVESIYNKYKNKDYQSLQGISYKELFLYFNNKITLEEAIELIKKNTRNYAKRQYTWFNNQFKTNWFELNLNNRSETVKKIINFLE